MRIRNNISALDTRRFLGIATKNIGNVIEKLSSGYRINSADDDAAGLSISEKMRAKIRGLDQASRNAQDGISLIQTAEGALGEIHSMLQRIHELSIQATNDTNNTIDRESIQDEIGELAKEIDSTAIKTEFNDRKLLDGSLSANDAVVSSPLVKLVNSQEAKNIIDSNSNNMNIIYTDMNDNFETVQANDGNATISGYNYLKNILQTQIVPQAVTGILNAYSPAFNYLSSASIGIGLKLYNDPSDSVLAYVSVGAGSWGDSLSYQLAVNMSSLVYNNGQLTDNSRSALETTIAHEMVHAFMDEAVTNGMFGSGTVYTGTQANYARSSEAFPFWFMEGMAQTAAGGYANCNDWINSGIGINTNTSQSTIASRVTNSNYNLTSGTTASKYATGYLACMYLGYLASGSSSISATSISAGLGKILSDIASGKSFDATINEVTNGKYTSVSDFESKFGDSSSSSFIYTLTQIVGNSGNGGLVTGNLTDSDLLPNVAISTSLFELNTQNDRIDNTYPSDVNVFSGGSRSTGGTAPIGDYGSTITNSGNIIDLSNIKAISGVSYDSINNILTITSSGNYTFKGINTNGARIVVNNDVVADVTLNNTSIDTTGGAGISLEGNANLTLNLIGTNSVITSNNGAAGIRVASGSVLNIQGNGTLIAKGGDYGAGIGGRDGENAGTINIDGAGVIVKATAGLGAYDIGGGRNGSNGTITKTRGIIFEGMSGNAYGNVTLSGTLDCEGRDLTVQSGSTLIVSTGGKISNASTFINNGTIENHGIIGSVSGNGITHHYASSISKSIIQPTDATVGKNLDDIISELTPSRITVFYNGTSRTLTGNWSVKDQSGNIVTDLTGTVVGADDTYTYTVTFASQDDIYFDPSNMQNYTLIREDKESQNNYSITDDYVSILGPSGGGNAISYSYKVSPASTSPTLEIGGLKIQVGSEAGQTIGITIDSVRIADLGIDNLSVLTRDDAEKVIDKSYEAIKKVSHIRSNLGSLQNTLEHIINNVDNMSENLQLAESRIRDLDMAKAMMQYSKFNVLMQTGQAMLVQANQTDKSVLSLLS